MKRSALVLRNSVTAIRSPIVCHQRRWAQVHDVRFFAAHQRPDRVQDKYRQKLDEKARERGLNSIDELKEAYSQKIQHLKKQAIVSNATTPTSAQQSPAPSDTSQQIPFQAPPPPKPQRSERTSKTSKDPVKSLSSMIDVEKTAALPPKEIEAIWRLRHIRDGQSLCAVMQTETFRRIIKTARKHPQFILPLPRENEGAEIHFLQWTFPSETTATVLFTHLAEYKLRGEFAQPHTTITHHLDLADSNGLVLMEGRVMENNGVSVEEGRWLLMCLQKFYGFEAHTDAAKSNANNRQRLMEQFSGGDANFKVEELLEEAEKVP